MYANLPGDNANTLQNIQNSMKYLPGFAIFSSIQNRMHARDFVLTLVREVLDVIKTSQSLPAAANPPNTNKLGLKLGRSEQRALILLGIEEFCSYLLSTLEFYYIIVLLGLLAEPPQ